MTGPPNTLAMTQKSVKPNTCLYTMKKIAMHSSMKESKINVWSPKIILSTVHIYWCAWMHAKSQNEHFYRMQSFSTLQSICGAAGKSEIFILPRKIFICMLHIMILHSSRTLNTICKLSLNKQTQKEKKIRRTNRVGPAEMQTEMQTRGVCKSAIEIINGQARRAATETGLSCCRNNPSSS